MANPVLKSDVSSWDEESLRVLVLLFLATDGYRCTQMLTRIRCVWLLLGDAVSLDVNRIEVPILVC